MKGKINFFGLLCLLSLLMFAACSEQAKKKKTLLPSSTSRIDELVVVMEDELWKTGMGDTLRSMLTEEYGILPQPEPMFDLRHVEGSQLVDLLKRSSIILIIGVLDGTDNGTAKLIRNRLSRLQNLGKGRPNYFLMRNIWSEPQSIIYLQEESPAKLMTLLRSKKTDMIEQIYKVEDVKANNNNYVPGISDGLTKLLKEEYNVQFDVPRNYEQIVGEDNFLWIRYDNSAAEQSNNIMIYTVNYGDTIPYVTSDYAIKLRNEMGKRVESQVKGAYMVSDNSVLPFDTTVVRFAGYPALKTFGLWRMKKDFMGGPFVNYCFDDKKNKRIVSIDGFIYGPKHDKRVLVRKLDVLMNEMRF